MIGNKSASVVAFTFVLIACTVASQRMASARFAEEPRAGTFEVYADKSGEHRWRLVALNGKTVATSGEGYKEKRDCLAGIDAVRRIAPNADVKELAESPSHGDGR